MKAILTFILCQIISFYSKHTIVAHYLFYFYIYTKRLFTC